MQINDILKASHSEHIREARRFLSARFFVDHSAHTVVIRDHAQDYLALDRDTSELFLQAVDALEYDGLVREIAIHAVASRVIQAHLQLSLNLSGEQGRTL